MGKMIAAVALMIALKYFSVNFTFEWSPSIENVENFFTEIEIHTEHPPKTDISQS